MPKIVNYKIEKQKNNVISVKKQKIKKVSFLCSNKFVCLRECA